MEYQKLKDKNFMTPNIIRYEESKTIKGTRIEYSRGKGFTEQTIFGVTVWKDYRHNHGLSEMFHSSGEAEDYIEEILN